MLLSFDWEEDLDCGPGPGLLLELELEEGSDWGPGISVTGAFWTAFSVTRISIAGGVIMIFGG